MIDISKPLMTRNGQSVEIITFNGRGAWPIVGYIGKQKKLSNWRKDGSFESWNNHKHPYDLMNKEQPKVG